MSDPIISLRGLTRQFQTGAETVTVLRDVDLDIHRGELVAIMGQSGSGKSTLMNILGCLDRATSGTYRFAGREVGKLAPDALAELRREHFGFIFQRYQLLPDLDAVENVEVPAVYAGVDDRSASPRHCNRARPWKSSTGPQGRARQCNAEQIAAKLANALVKLKSAA